MTATGSGPHDMRAIVVAEQVDSHLQTAAILDMPARQHALRALATCGVAIRSWSRWTVAAVIGVAVAPAAVAIGVVELLSDAQGWWSIPAVAVGSAVLFILVVGLWRVAQQAMDLTVGMYLAMAAPTVGPPEDKPGGRSDSPCQDTL